MFSLIEELNIVFILKCVISLVIGFVLGIEREYRAKPAGIKTYAMICLGATIFTHMSISMAFPADPSRIAAQIVSGLGFIGAGAIFQSKRMITGLTTAATLWVVGSLGVLVGMEYYVESFICLGFIYVYFLITRLIQNNKHRRFKFNTTIKLFNESDIDWFDMQVKHFKLSIISKSIQKSDCISIQMTYLTTDNRNEEFIKTLILNEYVKEVTQ
ncbi:hypothetical protein DID78_01920 [Candidatus Marinamargulisbacteria bacterium SCGC AG-343-D04]|nr:hypothetical protein DID78_01920 [Candidatus Marinamargulisbacteria bacterium SCGC AG-343-D04]